MVFDLVALTLRGTFTWPPLFILNLRMSNQMNIYVGLCFVHLLTFFLLGTIYAILTGWTKYILIYFAKHSSVCCILWKWYIVHNHINVMVQLPSGGFIDCHLSHYASCFCLVKCFLFGIYFSVVKANSFWMCCFPMCEIFTSSSIYCLISEI